MRLIIFALVFIILMAPDILAAGLKITEIDFNVDYDEADTYRIEGRDRKDSGSVSIANDSKIDADILPGSSLTFTVRVENTFQGEDPKIRGVFVTTTIEDIDDGADLDEESLDFDLEPGDDYRFDVKFPMPLDVEAGAYNVVIEAEGEDRNETSYNTEVNLRLEVKKQSHDIRITKVLLTPSIIDCDRKAKLTAEVMNLGSNAENEVALEFKATSLGINSYDKDIFLGSSDEASEEEKMHTKTLNIEVPSFLRAGNYPIFINLYWKNFVLFDQKTVDLAVKDCASAPTQPKPEEKEENKKTEVVTVVRPKELEEAETGETKQEEVITATREVSISDSPVLLSMLLGGFVIIMLGVLIAFGYLRSKMR